MIEFNKPVALYSSNSRLIEELQNKNDFTYRSFFYESMQKSTVHGVSNIVRSRGLIKNFFWILMICGMAAGLIYNMYNLTNKYLARPVSVSISLNNNPNLPFPSVTFCNMNPVKKSALETLNIPKLLGRKKRSSQIMLQMKSEDVSLLYVDGVLISTIANTSWSVEISSLVQSIAVRMNNLPIAPYFLLASEDNSILSNNQWKCYDTFVANWMNPDFDDSLWPAAIARGTTPTYPNISPNAQWISSGRQNADVFCRIKIYSILSTVFGNVWYSITAEGICIEIEETTTAQTSVTTDFTLSTSYLTTTQILTSVLVTTTIPQTTTLKFDTTNLLSTTTASKTSILTTPLTSQTTQVQKTLQNTVFYSSSLEQKTYPKSNEIKCCCRCCSDELIPWRLSTCQFCQDIKAVDALVCALTKIENSVLINVLPSESAQFVPSKSMEGSSVPGRLAYSDSFQKQIAFYEKINTLSTVEKMTLGYDVNDLIISCKYDNKNCDMKKDFEQFLNPINGNCFVFNSGWQNSSSIQNATNSGPRHGLTIHVNIDQLSYIPQAGSVAGVKLIVLGQNELAFPEDEGLIISPGTSVNIGLSLKYISRLPKPFGDCNYNMMDNKRSVYTDIYSVNYRTAGCERTCYQQHIMRKCECYDIFYPFEGISFNEFSKLNPCSISNITQDDCKYNVSIQFSKKEIKCDCPDRCIETYFVMDTSMASWPSKAQQTSVFKMLQENTKWNGSISEIDKNFMEIKIFYSNFIVSNISEAEGYSLVQYFSDTSGVVGLWFGFAFMTFIETIEFFADLSIMTSFKIAKKCKK